MQGILGGPRVALILAAGLGVAACRARRPEKQTNEAPTLLPRPAPVKILYPTAPGSFVRVSARLRPSLVNLHARAAVSGGPATALPPRRGADDPFFAASPMRERVARSLGTALILDRKGYALTALSVLGQAAQVLARLHDGRVLKVKLVGRDVDTGVAVLRLVLPATGKPVVLTPARLGDSSQLRPGDWVVAVGDPFGTAPYLSAGLVGSPGAARGLTLARPGYFSFISTDARINVANVGGPLVNAAGEVVGINVMLDDRQRAMGFAVPINMIRDVLPTLLRDGQVTRSWVGIYARPVTRALATRLGMGKPRGALVGEVIPGGPGARAGLRPGDVILEFDGKRVVRHQDLAFAAAREPSGKTVQVKIWRHRREHLLSLELQRKPQ